MDASSARRKSHGIGTTVSNKVALNQNTSLLSGMKASLSRPDSLMSPALVPASEGEARPFRISAASSGLDISKERLIELLTNVEDEYDKVIKENARLKAQIEAMSRPSFHPSSVNLFTQSGGNTGPASRSSVGSKSSFPLAQTVPVDAGAHSPPLSSVDSSLHKLKILKEEQLQKFKSSRRKIASATSRLRNVPSAEAAVVRSFSKHNDGVWDVTVPRAATCPYAILASASADRTACVWNAKTGQCLTQYQGHDGAVNSVRFMSMRVSMGDSILVLTASGDCTAHVWKVNASQLASKDEQGESLEGESSMGMHSSSKPNRMLVNYPLMVLRSHTNAVSCAEWISGNDQIITASWDRSAIVFDVETGDNLNTFAGHDDELTYVSVCRPQKLFVTCSKDATFRLWDLREPTLQSVSVFQGHTEAVNCAVFTPSGDSIVSGGDDRVLRVWDLRNMRSPKSSVRMDGGINRLSISESLVVAAPLDNRAIELYSITTGKLTRLPRAKRLGHQRMVTAAAWFDDYPQSSSAHGLDINLITSAFDRQIIGWKTLVT